MAQKINSEQMAPSKTVDANGWTVYDYGTFKHYSKKFSVPSQTISANGGVLSVTGNNLPSGVTVANAVSMQYSLRFNGGSPFVISNLDGTEASQTDVRIGVAHKTANTTVPAGNLYVDIWT